MKDVAKIVAAAAVFGMWAALAFGVPIAVIYVVVHFIAKWW